MKVVLVEDKIIINSKEYEAKEWFFETGKEYEATPLYLIKAEHTGRGVIVQQDGFVPVDNYKVEEEDIINKPSHYTQTGIEAIDYLKSTMSKEAYQGFLEGNVKKYMHRFRFKNGIEDLKKANWYLNKLIKELEE
jgi:hypothetical protein